MEFDGIMNKIAAAAEKNIPINDGDYKQDGLYFCGKCHTPKQCVVVNPFSGKQDVRRCLCACEQKAHKEREAYNDEMQRRIKVMQLRSYGLHDKSLADKSFEHDNGKNPNMRIAEKYVARWDEMRKRNVCAVFSGSVGCGKTYAAACIANALIDRGVPVLMATSSKIIDRAMSFDAGYDFLREMREYDLVIIDDFGAERNTEFAMQKLFDVIDARINQGKPMILTTNLSERDLKHPKDLVYQRIFSRIVGSCAVIGFTGSDLRAGKAEENLRKAYDLLV